MKKLQVLLVALLLLLPLVFVPRASAQTPPPFVGRIAGADRIGTAIALSQAAWPSPPVDAVLVARADAFPDALAAGPLARQLNGPILLTNSTELLAPVANEIRRLAPDRIFLLGGEAALSQGVENALNALAPDVERLAGASRYATAEAIADRTEGNVAAVASGENFPDALSANSLAPSDILLTQRDVLSFDPRRLGPTTIVGGTAVIGPDLLVAPRLAGANRYLTNLEILREVLSRRSGQFQLFVATGENFPDALAAGSLTQPILLVNPAWTELPAQLEAFLTDNRARFNAVFIFGGTGAVPEATERLVAAALGVTEPEPDPTETVAPEPPPAAPSGLTAAAASPTRINLAWTDNSDNETSFDVQRAPGMAETFTTLARTDADATAYADEDLDPETEYCYRVRAVNNAGASTYTAVRCATTPAAPVAPAAPSSLVLTPTSPTAIDLAWTDNSDDEDNFEIQRAPIAGGPFSPLDMTAANDTTYTDDALTAETQYCYRVRAVNPAGASAYTAATCATTPAPPNPPAAPSQLVVIETGPTRISINWDDNASNETGFEIQRRIGQDGAFSDHDTTGANDTTNLDTDGVEPGTEYCYRVRAVNADGASAYTEVVCDTTRLVQTLAEPPTSLATTAVSSSSIALDWMDNSLNELQFLIERRLGPDGTFSQIGTRNFGAESFTDTGLDPGTEYCYRVRATNEAGESAYSNIDCNTTEGTPPIQSPAPPSDLTVTAETSTAIRLNWTDNSNNETGFEVQRRLGTESTFATIQELGDNTESFTDEGLDPETEYCYRVRATNSAGDSTFTTVECATTPASGSSANSFSLLWSSAVGNVRGWFG